MEEYSPKFELMKRGDRVNMVASLVCFDDGHANHLMNSNISGTLFSFSGTIPQNKLTYSLLNVRVVNPLPRPLLVSDEDSRILFHDTCSWSSIREVIEVCAGIGGIGQGLLSVGFNPVVACDFNPLMVSLYSSQTNIPTVTGDVADLDTVVKIWEAHPHSSTIAAGVSCQPYSALGDRGSGLDPRSKSLPATLACAHYLRSVVVILECVSPAQSDAFVRMHVDRFCRLTGFHCSEAILRLQDCWPCSRTRWWCILSAPALGPIPLRQMPIFTDCSRIEHVMPYIIRWPFDHEYALQLNDEEKKAFQVDQENGSPFLLRRAGILPCPLHAWGS